MANFLLLISTDYPHALIILIIVLIYECLIKHTWSLVIWQSLTQDSNWNLGIKIPTPRPFQEKHSYEYQFPQTILNMLVS